MPEAPIEVHRLVSCGTCEWYWLHSAGWGSRRVECPRCGKSRRERTLRTYGPAVNPDDTDQLNALRDLRGRLLASEADDSRTSREADVNLGLSRELPDGEATLSVDQLFNVGEGDDRDGDDLVDYLAAAGHYTRLEEQVSDHPIGRDRFSELVDVSLEHHRTRFADAADRVNDWSQLYATDVDTRIDEHDHFGWVNTTREGPTVCQEIPLDGVDSAIELPGVDDADTFEEAGVSFRAGGQTELAAELHDVKPSREVVDDLLATLLPATVRAVQAYAREHGFEPGTGMHTQLAEKLYHEHGVTAGEGAYAMALAKFALDYHAAPELAVDGESLSERIATADASADQLGATGAQSATRGRLVRTLTRFASGQDAQREVFTSADEARRQLVRAVVPVLALRDEPVRLHVALNGPAWTEQVERNKAPAHEVLDVLEVLGLVTDIRLSASDRAFEALHSAFPTRWDGYLTATADGSRHDGDTSADEVDPLDAYRAVRKLGIPARKKRTVLAAMPRTGTSTPSALADDDRVLAAENSVSSYLGQLVDVGLVEEAPRSGNERPKSLTPLGRAAQDLLDSDLTLIHPFQTDLQTSLTTPPHRSHKCSAMRQGKHGGGEDGADTAAGGDNAMPAARRSLEADVATVEPPEGGMHVQWLGDLDAETLHENANIQHHVHRLVARCDGVTCLDDRILPLQPTADSGEETSTAALERPDRGAGKVVQTSFIEHSHFDDADLDLQLITQWGGSDAVLVRLATALCHPALWTQLDLAERLGADLEQIPVDRLDVDTFVEGFLRGHQFGWPTFDEDAPDFDPERTVQENWWHRLRRKSSHLLHLLADEETYQNAEQGTQLKEDAHGLFTLLTKLFDAVGIDITIHIRVPDAQNILTDEEVYADFRDFWTHTAPKHTTWGQHAAHRHTVETDGDRLKYRLPLELDVTEPEASTTCRWVVAGAGADELQPHIASAIGDVAPREAVADGIEQAPLLDIPVETGNGYRAIREIVEDVLTQKGWEDLRPERATWSNPNSEDLRSLTRVLMAMTARGEPWKGSPFAAAEAVLSIPSREGREAVTTRDIEYALGSLSRDRFLPDHRESVRAFLQELLAAEGGLSPAELRARTGYSESTWQRAHGELEALGWVTREDDGLFATVSPWWSSPGADMQTTSDGEGIWPGLWDSVVDVAWSLALLLDAADALTNPEEVFSMAIWDRPPPDGTLHDAIAGDPALTRWLPVVATLSLDPPTDGETVGYEDTVTVVRVGRSPPGAEQSQTALTSDRGGAGVTTA